MAGAIENLKRTPLFAAHQQRGAKLVNFGGWEMPVQYRGILQEHAAVRQRAGLFDIAHMGEVLVAGPNAEVVLNHLLTNDVSKLSVGDAQYTLLCNDQGGIIDDLIVYRVEPTVFLLIVNASRIDEDFAWMNAHATTAAVFENISDRTAALALQGPHATRILPAASPLAPFQVARLAVAGIDCWVARTGYTGEDGFELVCAADDVRAVWDDLLVQGDEHGIEPCGLGARDVLRLEMCYPLYGNDISETTSPLEAGLGKFVALDKPEFVGRDALVAQRDRGLTRKLVGFKMTGKSPPPRAHYPIRRDGQPIGEVTSGTQSPSLNAGIGMAYVAIDQAAPGTTVQVEIRGREFPAAIERKPLFKKPK